MGCQSNEETENELLICDGFGEENELLDDTLSYNFVFSESVRYDEGGKTN